MLRQLTQGFGLLEVIIALAITAILSTVTLTTYQGYIVRANQTAIKEELLDIITDFEKYYSQHGTYSTESGAAPSNIQAAVTAANMVGSGSYNALYQLDLYSHKATAGALGINLQAVCAVAKPRDGTIMSGTGTVIVNSEGNITVGSHSDAELLCGAGSINPQPEPTNDVPPVVPTPTATPAPTATPEPAPSNSPVPSPTATPTPSPTASPAPSDNRCFNQQGRIDFSDASKFPDCQSGSFGDVSGRCDGGTWLRCSGSCNDTILCRPFDTGCSGDCNRAFIYDAPCSGNCNDTTYYIELRDVGGICSGYCQRLTLFLPRAKYSEAQPPALCSISGNRCKFY